MSAGRPLRTRGGPASHMAREGTAACGGLQRARLCARQCEKDHPARPVIEEFKRRQRGELIRLYGRAGLADPESLADEFLLLIEGARVTAHGMGADGLGPRLIHMSAALIAASGMRRKR